LTDVPVAVKTVYMYRMDQETVD